MLLLTLHTLQNLQPNQTLRPFRPQVFFLLFQQDVPAAFLLILSLPLSLSAQEGRGKGRVRGEVYDEAGNPIEGAKVVATHLQSGTTFTGTSDKKGNWAVAGLGTGYFRFTVSAEGYGTTYHESRISQFAQRNPPIKFTLKKVQVLFITHELNTRTIEV